MHREKPDREDLRKAVEHFFAVINKYLAREELQSKSYHLSLSKKFFSSITEVKNDKYSLVDSFLKGWDKASVKDKTYKGLKRKEFLVLESYLGQEIVETTREIERLLGLIKNIETEVIKNKDEFVKEKDRFEKSFLGKPPIDELVLFLKSVKSEEDIKKEVFDHNEKIRINIASIGEVLLGSLKNVLKSVPWLEIPLELFGFMKIPRFYE